MDLITIIIFIIFVVARVLGQGQQQGKGRRPQRPQPHQREEERPWWEEIGDILNEPIEESPTPKKEPRPIVLKREDITQTKKVKDNSAADKLKQERELAKEKLAQVKKEQQEKVETEVISERPSYSAQGFNAQNARQGIIWAEILQPPKAKRRQGYRGRI